VVEVRSRDNEAVALTIGERDMQLIKASYILLYIQSPNIYFSFESWSRLEISTVL